MEDFAGVILANCDICSPPETWMTEFMEERSTDFGNFAKGRRDMSHIFHFSILALNRKLSQRDSH